MSGEARDFSSVPESSSGIPGLGWVRKRNRFDFESG